jgi:transposase InsO family protein
VNRDFSARGPDALWLADFSYLRCWEGLVFFSFVIDAFSRRVVGWQFASHMRTDLVLDALRVALGTRSPGADVALVHHSDAAASTPRSTTPRRSTITACSHRSARSGCL